jgi:hypothetical protein
MALFLSTFISTPRYATVGAGGRTARSSPLRLLSTPLGARVVAAWRSATNRSI